MPISIWLSVVRPMTPVSSGASIAIRGSIAAALTSASIDRLMPGAMIPPLYAPEASTTSNVVAVPKSMTMRSPSMLGVRRDHVERAVGADALRLVDVERDRPGRGALPRDQRLDVEIFGSQHFEIVQRAGNDGADDHRFDVGLGIAFELEQLVKPHRIFVRGSPRVGRDAPPRLDLAALTSAKTRLVFPASMASSMRGP